MIARFELNVCSMIFITGGYLIYYFRWKLPRLIEREQAQPECFASQPGPQQQAENCCDDCPWETQCLGTWR